MVIPDGWKADDTHGLRPDSYGVFVIKDSQ